MDGEITPGELAERLDDEDAVPDGDGPLVVDIRRPDAYRQGHIPESLNIPLPDLATDVSRVADADHVVTVCPHGKDSRKAARLVAAHEDFEGRVESLAGGLTAWEGALTRGSVDGPGGDETGEGADGRPEAPF